MVSGDYLNWVVQDTKTSWWHDSADPEELAFGIRHGATGVTSNPVLSYLSLIANKARWQERLEIAARAEKNPEARAESLMCVVLTNIAEVLKPQFERSRGDSGYVCAQVNPARAGDREVMLSMARRFHSWAPNIAVKLPVTAAGLDVLEECTAEGMTVTATVSFTVPQVVEIAERFRKGRKRALVNRVSPGRCFAVIMIGRLDDYLREVAHDQRADIDEAHIIQAGLAVSKRAYRIYEQQSYEATLLVAALRGTYHMSELVGARIVMSITPKYQKLLLSAHLPREPRISVDVPMATMARLQRLPEFVKSYEPDGMKPEEFITFGATQRTLSQFLEAGWSNLESFQP